MRPLATPRLSTSAKLTLVNALLLAVSFGLMLLLVTWLADRFMMSHVGESVDAEVHILEAEFQVDGPRGIAALITQRLQARSPNHDRSYRLESAEGQVLAGNLDHWPTGAGSEGIDFRVPSLRHPGETEVVMQWATLPDGSRLLVGYDEIEIAQVRHDLRRAAGWGFVALLVIALGVGLLLTRSMLRPVESIRLSAIRIMEGDLSHRIPVRQSNDEFDRLGQTLNAMLDRIEQLIDTVKGATDNIAHDLRSPLTRLRSRLEAYVQDFAVSPEQREAIDRSVADLDQVLVTFQSLLRIASVESGLLRADFAACDLGVLLRDAVEFVEPVADERTQKIVLEAETGLRLTGHRDLLFQAVLNLLDNAIKYGPAGGQITVRAWRDSQHLVVEIADQGPGIPQVESTRVFERLYRVDRSRSTPGLGLGLALVKAIVEIHRGQISIHDNRPGARVEIRFAI